MIPLENHAVRVDSNLSRIAEDPGRSSAVESQKFRVCAEVPGSSWVQLGFMGDPMIPMGIAMVGW
jgi:hypothetical protein